MNPAAESLALMPVESFHEEESAVEVVRRWHDDVHPGAFRFCSEQPCHAVGRTG